MIIFLGNNNTHIYKDFINKSKNDKDIVVSCQYPFRIPESLLESHICVNIHYGKLPEYAGCNPIYWQIMNGNDAGVTLHYCDKDFDSGDIIDQWICPTGNVTADQLFRGLERQGLKLLEKWYDKIIDGTAPRKKQDLKRRRYYKKDAVNFSDTECFLNDRKLRALHFEGKQYPTANINGIAYEIRSRNTCLQ